MSKGNVEEKEKEDGSSTVLYQQLQSEYNKLLKRYAEAENTIDELRTGATIHLYTDPLNAKPNSCRDFKAMRHSQRLNFPRTLQAVNGCDTIKDDTGMNLPGHDLNSGRKGSFSHHEKDQESLPSNTRQDSDLVERVKLLKEDMDSLENYLTESDVAPKALNEVSDICKQLDQEHEKLCRDFKIFKQSRCSSSRSEKFHVSSKRDLEKELHRLGLRLEGIQRHVSRRLNSGKTRQHCDFKPTQKLEESTSRKPTNQDMSSLDPDLADLVLKLKNLQDGGRNEGIMNSSVDDRSRVSPSEESFTSPPNRAQGSSSYELEDVVDARYFAASPVHLNYKHGDVGTGSEIFEYDVDHATFENEETSEKMTHWPSQAERFDSSETSRSRAESFKYSKRPMNAYDQFFFSNENRSSEGHSRPRSSLSDPRNETHFREDSISQAVGDAAHERSVLGWNEEGKNVSPVQDERRKSNSMSSLVDSSRMSTPLFQPRGATRVSPQDHLKTKYKRRNVSDGFDSGFVGSEGSRSSRMTSESPDIMRKLNLSNTWDSNLHLDLVSEIDENDSVASHDQLSMTYEPLTEPERQPRSPVEVDRTPCDTRESTLVHSSPSPSSSPDRSRRRPSRYIGKSTSRSTNKRSSDDSSVPVPRVQLADPSLSRITERTSSERSSRDERPSEASEGLDKGIGGYSRPGSREITQNVAVDHSESDAGRPRERRIGKRRISSGKDERNSPLALRNEIDRLRRMIKNQLDQPRLTMGMFNDLRRDDEDSRKALGRKNDRKLDELRESIERLTRAFHSRANSERHKQQTIGDSNAYDALRSGVKDLTGKLDELSELQKSSRSHPVSPKSLPTSFEDDVRQRLGNLVREVDKLKLRVDNDVTRDIERPSEHLCHLCGEADLRHHGYHPVVTELKPPTSTPLVSEIYQTTQRQPTIKAKNRSAFHHHSSTYPGVGTTSPVIHHIHTYHRIRNVKEKCETDSSSEEEFSTRRVKQPKRTLRRSRYEIRRERGHNSLHRPLAEASQAAQDVQRLSKNILNSISLDLASFRS